MDQFSNCPAGDFDTTIGRILDINQRNCSFTTISSANPASVIQFNLSSDTVILNRGNRRIPFSALLPGLRVRVRHAGFMTNSIPPQSPAFMVQIL